ncbi:MAG: copper chaperone PCu(A)C [Pseudomonadota bacterium]
MRHLILAAALLATPAFAADDDHSDHVSEIGDVRVIHAWARATDHDHTGVYFEVENNGDAEITIASATTEIAEQAQVMGASLKAGGEPIELGSFPVAPGTHFELSPTAVFIELDGLSGHLHEGDEFEMTVELQPLGTVVLNVEVEAENADTHSHAGHNH